MLTRAQTWLLTHVHLALYRLSGGRLGGGTLVGLQIVFLTTTGRKSGRTRTTPLNALIDGERWVLIASNGGQPHNPHWYGNLVANPSVSIEVRREKVSVRARVATPEEKAALWATVTATAKNYLGYQKKTARDIPLVILERA
jgi:deazaflavin-dependent oxidoreductase (nitroreductase family)